MAQRVAQVGDVWAEMLANGQSLRSSIERLQRA